MSRPDARLPVTTTAGLYCKNPTTGTDPSQLVADGLVLPVTTVAAGTAALTGVSTANLVQVATDGAQAHTFTLPEAADNIGLIQAIEFVTDGGVNLTVAVTGSDTIDEPADTGNTSWLAINAGETLIVLAVSDNKWAVIQRIGGTLS